MRRRLTAPDARAVAGVLLFVALLTLVSWRRWGNPELDAGADLTVADLVAHGAVPYRDVRYFYGPAGLYSLAAAFKVLGTSFTVAFAFGYVQTLAILGTFYALARTWLPAVTAGLATAFLAAIGFSGTLFNFVLPHTNAATFGLLFLLLEALALARRRPVLAGVAAGAVALTRPEFLAFAAAVAAGAVAGRWREAGIRDAGREALALLLPAVLVAAPILGALASTAGTHRLFFENLIPLDFVRVAGGRFQADWAPFTFASIVATAARGLVYVSLLAALVAATLRVRAGRGVGRLIGLWPLAAAVGGLLALDGAARILGVFPGSRQAVEDECVRLLLPMSWLPVAAAIGAVWGARRLWRGGDPPLRASWPGDLALLAGAAACGIRAYNDFTTDVYSTYYAALPLLVAAVGHQAIAVRWPRARPAVLAALGVGAAALSVHAYVGLYRDNNTLVRTARGGYLASDRAAPAIQRTVDLLRARTRPGEPLLALPDDPGLHFMADRPPALYEVTFLPGTLDSVADERQAIDRLHRVRPPYVVVGARRFDQYGKPEIGVDYNRELLAYVRRSYRLAVTYGDVRDPPRNSMPSEAFSIYVRRGVASGR